MLDHRVVNLKGNRQVVLKLQPDRSMTIQNWLKLPGDTPTPL